MGKGGRGALERWDIGVVELNETFDIRHPCGKELPPETAALRRFNAGSGRLPIEDEHEQDDEDEMKTPSDASAFAGKWRLHIVSARGAKGWARASFAICDLGTARAWNESDLSFRLKFPGFGGRCGKQRNLMKSKALFAATLAMAVGWVFSSSAADVTGSWKSEFETPVGQMKYTFELKADGAKLTGKAIRDRDGQKSEVEIKEGKINGEEVSFVETAKIQDQDIRIEYKGKVAGDEMKLSRTVGEFGSEDIVAKREKTASLAGKWQSDFETQIGKQNYVYEFKVEGEKVTGKASRTLDGQKTETPITEGKLTGADVSFVEVLKIPDQDQEIRIEYKGKISGDELKLNRKVADFATTDIVAKRMKDAEKK
jgi:hypothetical protein